jgi:hypothetical protein
VRLHRVKSEVTDVFNGRDDAWTLKLTNWAYFLTLSSRPPKGETAPNFELQD